MKYAIVESGGKQYKAVEGSFLTIDKLEAEPGQEITLDQVLLVVKDDAVKVGSPVIKDAAVKAVVVGEEKGPKLIIFKYRPKKHYRAKTGHRSD